MFFILSLGQSANQNHPSCHQENKEDYSQQTCQNNGFKLMALNQLWCKPLSSAGDAGHQRRLAPNRRTAAGVGGVGGPADRAAWEGGAGAAPRGGSGARAWKKMRQKPW